MRTPWVLFILLLSFALGSCSPSQNGVEDQQTIVPENTPTAGAGPTSEGTASEAANAPTPAITQTATAPTTAAETGEWAKYQHAQAGYSVEYPADWTVTESAGQITMFVAPNGEQGITVNVQNSEAVAESTPDLPNTRCEPVTVSGLAGQRCFDTLTFTISTTFTGPARQYAIVTFGKQPDEAVYQHFLDSFVVTP